MLREVSFARATISIDLEPKHKVKQLMQDQSGIRPSTLPGVAEGAGTFAGAVKLGVAIAFDGACHVWIQIWHANRTCARAVGVAVDRDLLISQCHLELLGAG